MKLTGAPRFLVGFDGSPRSTAALRWALDEARLHSAHLTACWAVGSAANDDPKCATPASRLEQMAADVVGAQAVLDMELVVAPTTPALALLDESATLDLLIVGDRGHGGFGSLLLGSVADRMLRDSACPVVIVRGEPRLEARTVVVGIASHGGSERALAWAAREARLRDASVRLVHAWSVPASIGDPRVPGWSISDVERAGAQTLEKAAADPVLAGLLVEQALAVGSAPKAIIDASDDAALVVVGTRGHGPIAAAVLGSTSLQLAHHAPCPVVVVR